MPMDTPRIRAELNHLRIAPRKVRLIADLIRGKRVLEAERVLRFAGRHAAEPLAKLLHSAVANARHNFQIVDSASLTIAEIRVDGGPVLKRTEPRAFGRASQIRKRTSHVTLILTSSAPAASPSRRRTAIAVAPSGAETDSESPDMRRAGPRPTLGEKPGKAPSRRGFAQRMFRRKAI